MTTYNVVIGVIGSDVHTIGSKLLSYALKKNGFNVADIGVAVSQEELINAAIETDAKAILVSSLYGHGELDCRGFREKCIESGLEGIRLYVGGNLVVGKREWSEVEKTFLDMGFDRVAPPATSPDQAIAWLRQDLG